MALYGQPNQWQCGPFALKHALLVQGISAHEDELARQAGSSEAAGTDEHGLARAAADYSAHLVITRCHSRRAARRTLARWLADHPVMLCLDQWEHWVTAVAADEQRVVVFDSHYDTVLRVEPWDTVLHRTVYLQPWRIGFGAWTWYDLHAVALRAPRPQRVPFTPQGAERLVKAGPRLMTRWDEYLAALRPLSDPHGAKALPDVLERVRTEVNPADHARLDDLLITAEAFGLRSRALRPTRVLDELFPPMRVVGAQVELPFARRIAAPAHS